MTKTPMMTKGRYDEDRDDRQLKTSGVADLLRRTTGESIQI